MKDGLTGFAAIVDDHPVSAFIEPHFFPERLCDKEQMSDKLPVDMLDAVDVSNVFFRDDQDMGWGLGVDVCERKSVFVLMHKRCGDLFLYDLAKKTVGIVTHINTPSLPA